MVDALVLEASTSVCGFESHLPHQKKRAPKGAFFFWCQGIWLCQMPPAAAGTSASLHVWQEPAVPPHTPPPFFVIPYSLRSKRTAPATGRGLEPNGAPGFFLCPNLRPRSSRSEPSRIKEATQGCLLLVCTTGFPKTALPEPVPQSGTPKLFTLLYSLFTCPAPAFPSHFPGAPESCSAGGRRISSPAAMRNCKTPFSPHSPACRAQACSEPVPQSGTPKLFSIHSSLFTLPALPPFPSGTDSKTKIYFVFLVT